MNELENAMAGNKLPDIFSVVGIAASLIFAGIGLFCGRTDYTVIGFILALSNGINLAARISRRKKLSSENS